MSEVPFTLIPIADSEDKSSPLKNRIRKNYRHAAKWARRTQTNCFRIYDRDIKEYPLCADYYGGKFSLHYFTDSRDTDTVPISLQEEVEEALASLFKVGREAMHWRLRVKRQKIEQYEKVEEVRDFFTVYEYGVPLLVNLTSYLDSGLFLDHRETRRHVAELCRGKRLLNLFAYTCSFSVHAAVGGASFTKSVDLSNTYLRWGRNNFALNALSANNNEFVREDCMKFLEMELQSGNLYDIIVIDPPTLSRSKKMVEMFDVQRDYSYLIEKALLLLAEGGVIFFSTNSKKFVFDQSLFSGCSIANISHKTIPFDFHNKKIHKCWKICLNK